LYIYVIISESKEQSSIKRPEKLPFSDSDISKMTPKQLSLLGLKEFEISEYLNKNVEKSKKKEIKESFNTPKQLDDDDEIFTSLRKKPQSSIHFGYTPFKQRDTSRGGYSDVDKKLDLSLGNFNSINFLKKIMKNQSPTKLNWKNI
jgi:hypothetical protein